MCSRGRASTRLKGRELQCRAHPLKPLDLRGNGHSGVATDNQLAKTDRLVLPFTSFTSPLQSIRSSRTPPAPGRSSSTHTQSTKHHIPNKVTPRDRLQKRLRSHRHNHKALLFPCPKPTPPARHSRQTRTVRCRYRLPHSLAAIPRMLGDRREGRVSGTVSSAPSGVGGG
jgi:hypothetical protein